jgi:hypothetical protein
MVWSYMKLEILRCRHAYNNHINININILIIFYKLNCLSLASVKNERCLSLSLLIKFFGCTDLPQSV